MLVGTRGVLVIKMIAISLHLASGNTFLFPDGFVGLWSGVPEFTPMGPLSDNYTFGLSQTLHGDYLLQDTLEYDHSEIGWQRYYVEGSGDTAGTLWYCGVLLGEFARRAEDAGFYRPDEFVPIEQTASSVTFCLNTDDPAVTAEAAPPYPRDCEFCDCANWTLSLDKDRDLLRSHFSMAGSPGHTHARHLSVTYSRMGPAPEVNTTDWPGHGANFSCDFAGRDAVPVDVYAAGLSGCPHSSAMLALPRKSASNKIAEPLFFKDRSAPTDVHAASILLDTYPSNSTEPTSHCYILNEFSDYRLAWTLHLERGEVDIEVSAFAADTNHWVAIGFRPQGRATNDTLQTSYNTGDVNKFGMAGADIVVGHGSGQVQTYYAELYTGPPDASEAALAISNAVASFDPSPTEAATSVTSVLAASSAITRADNTGTIRLSFTRVFSGTGKLAELGLPLSQTSILSPLADLIWAVGSSDSASSGLDPEPTCSYHANIRGLRIVNWVEPSSTFPGGWKCS